MMRSSFQELRGRTGSESARRHQWRSDYRTAFIVDGELVVFPKAGEIVLTPLCPELLNEFTARFESVSACFLVLHCFPKGNSWRPHTLPRLTQTGT